MLVQWRNVITTYWHYVEHGECAHNVIVMRVRIFICELNMYRPDSSSYTHSLYAFASEYCTNIHRRQTAHKKK
jgi:hypothetical protein